eukprot:scpid89795/ scgid35610/ 
MSDEEEKFIARFANFNSDVILATWHVYSDLAYKKVWKMVEVLPCNTLRIPYLVGQEEVGCPKQIFVPVRASDEHSIVDMEKLLEHVGKEIEDISRKAIVLAIVDSDSTIVYYTIQSGVAVQDDRAVRAIELSGDDKRPALHRKSRGEKRKRDIS